MTPPGALLSPHSSENVPMPRDGALSTAKMVSSALRVFYHN